MRVLITGGAGYIGSVLSELALQAGHDVTVLDNVMYGQHSLLHLCSSPRFEFVRGDARDEDLLRSLLRDTEAIVPLAALVGAPACDRDPTYATSVNLDAIRLLNRLRGSEQLIVFPTTNSGYGTQTGATACTEDTPLEPISLYGRDKVDAESELLASRNALTLRLATVFGTSPRMRVDLLVNHFVYLAVSDGYIVVFEKDFRRNYIHVRDVADCVLYALEHADRMVGRAFNAGLEGANLSKEELALKVRNHVPGLFVHFAEVGSDPDKRDYVVSNARLLAAGFEATRSLDDGIEELIKGYRLLGSGRFRNA